MITNISYKHCECDMCGKSEDIESTLLLPEKWQKIRIYFDYITCQECTEKLYAMLKSREDKV